MKLREKRERLLVGLYLSARNHDLPSYYDLREVADDISLPRGPGELRTIANDMERSGLVSEAFTMGGGDEGGLDVRIVGYGAETAEDLLDAHPEYATEKGNSAPAADRYVAITDNQRGKITPDLRALVKAVEDSNEGTEEDRLIAASEIAAFEATISQPRVSSDLVDRFVKVVLLWLAATFSAALVDEVATALIGKLLQLISPAN